MEKVSLRAKLVNKLLIVAVVILISFIICLQIAGVNFEQQTMMAIVIFVLATSGAMFYLHQTIDILAAKLDLVDSSLPYLKNNDLNGFDNLNQDAYPAFFRSVSRLMVLEEKELATSNEQLAAINKSLAVIEFNIDGTIITANDNFLMTLGYRLEEIQGQHHSMFVDHEYKTSIEYQQFWAKLNRGEYDNAEYKRIGNEGKEVWIQASYNPILDSQGKVCKIVKFATDITATKLAMSDFQGQISAIDKSQAVIEFNLDGIILNANDNFLNTVDYQLNEIKGKQHSMFVEPEYKASSEYQQFWDKLNRGEFQTGEYKRIGKFGKEIWIQASYNPIFDLNGNVYKVVKFATDVTSTKLIMADFEGQISAIDKSQAVIEFNMDGTIINANDNFLNTVGYQLNEIKGQHHSMFVEPEYKVSSEYQQFWQKLNRGEFEADEFKRIGQGGKEIWIQASYNPIFDLNGKPFKVVKYASDITEQKNQAAATALIARTVSALDVCQANVMMADADYNIVYVNEAVTAMLSTNEQQLRTVLPRFNVASLIGTNIDTFHKNPAHQRGMLDNLKSTYQTDLELAGFTFGLIATPVFNNNGERLGTVVEWEDKTERLTSERAERAEAAENLRIKQALDNVSANAMIADAGNNIVFMNEAVQGMMRDAEADIRTDLPNFNSNNLVGQNVDVFHKNPAHQQNMLKNLASTYKTEIVVGGRTFSLIANPITSDNGERVGTVVEWNDRTAEVAIEKEIDGIIASAGRGELDARLEEGDKSGFFLNLTQGLNTLVEIVDDAVAETGFMLDAMAHGDLTKRIEKDYQGSFDKLKRDANTTAEKLTEVIDQINTSATLVASGAEEISQGNADLSQRTEEQASSLEETASSMEEMTSTVRQNADNAKVANELAANTQEQASQGGEVVQRAVNSMAEINDSSKKISDIIGVIDEIAFQTNLLALNAAVEAARAGEQGRGFAVVAGEVRNLAQRSAAAAKEIKELIRDSVSKVEDGTLLVNESGTTLQKIVLSVQKVTEMIADITVASEEQSSGIEQVNKAITQMDEMTQQNAALVEEASAAGESMAEQANGMRQLLTFFKSNAGGNASALPVSTYSKPAPKVAAPSRAQRLSSPSTGDDFVDSADEWEEF